MEVFNGHRALVPPIEVLLQVIDLALDQLRLHLLEQILELCMGHLIVGSIRYRVLIVEVLGVNFALDENFLNLLYNLLRIDARELVDKLIEVNRRGVVHVEPAEESTRLIIV